MFPEVHTTTHRGIPVRWADLPGPLTGTLIFGVGHRDEPAPLMGITHLIEHLAFRAIEPILVHHNGVVTDDSLTFSASGDPSGVAQFLNDICQALNAIGSVSETDLELEKSVICTESCSNLPTAGLLTYRFGLGGLGNANASHRGGHSLTVTELAAWSDTWLTATNSVLSFTRPVPDTLAIDLPLGSRPPRWTGSPVVSTPRLVASSKVGVALSLVVGVEYAVELGCALRETMQHRLRHELGVVYSPDLFFTRIDDCSDQLDLILDPDCEHVPRVVEEVVSLLAHIVADGFGATAVEAVRTQRLTELAWSNSAIGSHLDEAGVAELLGVSCSTPEVDRGRAESFTSEHLTAALIGAVDSMILAYDDDAELDPNWLEASSLCHDTFDIWDETLAVPKRRGRRWWGKLRGDASGVQATVHDGVLTTRSRAAVGSIRLSELVTLGRRSCGCVDLVDARGRSTVVDPNDWYRGESLTAAIVAHARPEVVRSFASH